MGKAALLIVDVQNALVEGHPHNEEKLIDNIKCLLAEARKHQTDVIYVRHGEESGSEFEPETHGWQIYDAIAPNPEEKIFEKRFNSAFHKTELKAYLDDKAVDKLVLVGMQTEYCIDATLKSAFDLGYEMIVPEGSNSTFDNDLFSGENLFVFYNYYIWNNRFAKVLGMDEALTHLR